MAVRNFWVEGDVEGRAGKITGGPKRKDGGFVLHVYQRDNGRIINPIDVIGEVTEQGTLKLSVWDSNAECRFEHETER